MRRSPNRFIVVLPFLCMPFGPARATNPSAVSEVSVVGVSALGEASYELIVSGARLVITAVSSTAEVGTVVVSAAGTGVSATLQVSAEVASEASAHIGEGIERVAVSGGWLLSMDGRALCFVPDHDARRHLHRRALPR